MKPFGFGHKHYVAALRAKAGEFRAVRLFTEPQRAAFTPLWELQPLDDDVEPVAAPAELTSSLQKTIAALENCWRDEPAFVDAELLDGSTLTASGVHPLEEICDLGAARGVDLIPVTSPSYTASSHVAAANVHSKHNTGIAIRLTGANLSNIPALTAFVSSLASAPFDLIIDLEYLSEELVAAIIPLLPIIINALAAVHNWRTFILLAGSFPQDMAGQGQGTITFSRPEWPAWLSLVTSVPSPVVRLPSYGDYAISHPHYLRLPPIVVVTASIRYTADTQWYVFRGLPLATIGPIMGHGYMQFQALADLCRTTIPPYRGAAYSSGDGYIDDCANGSVGVGNTTIWRYVGTSQHITYTAASV